MNGAGEAVGAGDGGQSPGGGLDSGPFDLGSRGGQAGPGSSYQSKGSTNTGMLSSLPVDYVGFSIYQQGQPRGEALGRVLEPVEPPQKRVAGAARPLPRGEVRSPYRRRLSL
jgi:hypothetical protein